MLGIVEGLDEITDVDVGEIEVVMVATLEGKDIVVPAVVAELVGIEEPVTAGVDMMVVLVLLHDDGKAKEASVNTPTAVPASFKNSLREIPLDPFSNFFSTSANSSIKLLIIYQMIIYQSWISVRTVF